MNNKKILLYGGGAIILGAVGFFVWSFFQKIDVPLAENIENTPDDKSTNSGTNFFNSQMGIEFEPIKTPDILDWSKNNYLR
ncbi:MAG: hypothetical protein QG594_527 [Bacteroidota bacterium]|nr:hypothetical protein [Bacteroidota bacterium]